MVEVSFWRRRFCALLLGVLASACGGGGGGGGGSSTPVPSPPPQSTAPQIAASIATFPVNNIPSEVLSHSGTSLAVVSVASASGEPVSTAVVSVNDIALAYVADSKTYRGWVVLTSEDTVTLNVKVNGATYSATARQPAAFPEMVSPAPVRPVAVSDGRIINVDRSLENVITWTGVPPGPDSQYALAVLDERGELLWPSRSGFRILPRGSSSPAVLPAGSLPPKDQFANIAVGITRAAAIANASAESSLVVGSFSQAQVYTGLPRSPELASLTIRPGKLGVAVQHDLQLSARGVFADYMSSEQDLTGRVAWTSDSPGIADVSSTGLVTGKAAGTATITATMGAKSTQSVVTVFAPRPAPAAEDSVAFQVDAAHTGHASFGVPLAFPSAPAWSVTLPGEISYPLIANGAVFAISGAPGADYTQGASLHAFDASTGQYKWGPVSVGTSTAWAGQALDQGKLFLLRSDGLLQAFDAETGERTWSVPLGAEASDVWQFGSSPTAYKGVVYVLGAGVGSTLYAIDGATGKVLWYTPGMEIATNATIAVADDGVYVSGYFQYYRIDPASGAKLWHYVGHKSGGGGYTPALFNGRLYIRLPSEPYFEYLNALTAETVMPAGVAQGENPEVPIMAAAISAFHGGMRFEVSGGTLYGIDLATEKVVWRYAGKNLVSAPISIDQYVFAAASNGMVFGVDAAGNEVWSGVAGSTVAPPDEWNAGQPLTGMAAGRGLLVVPAKNVLTAFRMIAR